MDKSGCTAECEDFALIATYVEYMERKEKLKPVNAGQSCNNGWKQHGRKSNREGF